MFRLLSVIISVLICIAVSASLPAAHCQQGENGLKELKSNISKLRQQRKELEKAEEMYSKLLKKYREIARDDPRRSELRQEMTNYSMKRSKLSRSVSSIKSAVKSSVGRIVAGCDKKSVIELLQLACTDRKPLDIEIEEAVINGLANTKDAAIVDYLIETLAGAGNKRMAGALCEIMKRRKEKKAVDALIGLLKKSGDSVKISAAKALSHIRSKKAIKPMIDALTAAEKPGKKESLARGIMIALQDMTGKYDFTYASEFRGWWEKKGKEEYDENKTPAPRSAAKLGENGEHKTILYGTITSKRAIFVCDVSGSMRARGRIPEKPDVSGGTTAPGQPPTGGGRRLPGTPEKLPDNLGEKGVPPGYYGTRIAMLKIELAYVVKTILAEDAKFNIIAYSQNVQKWEKSLTHATDKKREAAIEFVKKMQANGGTNTYGALKEAFEDKHVDTIYLLSDGNPTVGEKIKHEDILAAVRRWNRDRSIVIHTIGLLVGKSMMENKEKLTGFLTKLANENGGTVKILTDK